MKHGGRDAPEVRAAKGALKGAAVPAATWDDEKSLDHFMSTKEMRSALVFSALLLLSFTGAALSSFPPLHPGPSFLDFPA